MISLPRIHTVLPASDHLFRFSFDFAVKIDKSPLLQFLDGRARLARILGFKDDFQFFERDTLRLHVEEIDEDELEKVPEDEEHIEPVANLCSQSVILLSQIVGFIATGQNPCIATKVKMGRWA